MSPQGERGASGGASGQNSNNPNKKCRELNPPDPKFVQCKHHQSGKWIKKPRPSGMPFPGSNNKSMQCDDGSNCQKVAQTIIVGGATYVVYRCIRMLPSLLPPLWPSIPANAAIP
ncbi:MAG: hypothetical protein OQL19_11090 [Gammaproteobacteria bacterium]|nr:hypothetical protein [Gammaproteobacteria bacterium]